MRDQNHQDDTGGRMRAAETDGEGFDLTALMDETDDETTAGTFSPGGAAELIAPAVGMFNRGQHAEQAGFGIGAMAYYRRALLVCVPPMFDTVIAIAEKMNVGDGTVAELKRAKNEFSFDRPISEFKAALPVLLLIKGHNPFALLHRAMNEGQQSDVDQDCLELAGHIHVVLAQLADKISAAMAALEDDAEINKAIARLA